jgi:hypothetical protein
MKPKVHELQKNNFNCGSKVKMLPMLVLLLFTINGFAQITRIETLDGARYITTAMDYPIIGTYYFHGAEPVVELNAGGNGFYQLHEQPKRAVNWGIECDQTGVPIFTKGFDNAAYTLWFQYTVPTENDDEASLMWKPVGFTIHFNSQKMFIQGERCKTYSGEAER